MDEVIEKASIPYTGLGVSGLQYTAPLVYEEFLPQLRYPRAAKVYQEMSDNDPVIGAILYMSEQLIRKAGWRVVRAGDSAVDREAEQFLDECMHDMSHSWDDFITEVLSMLPYGFSFHEIIYKIRKGPGEKNPMNNSKYSDGRIGWRKLPGRSQATLDGWEFNDVGDVTAFVQVAPPRYEQVSIPLDRGILFRTKSSRGNPEGRSLLRNAYRPWYFKKHIEEIEGIGIERDLAGLPVLKLPQGLDIFNKTDELAIRQRTAAETLVRNIRRDQNEGVILPDGWELELLSTGGSRQFDTNAIVNRYDQRISITLLSDLVMMGGDKVGSFALGDMKKSLLSASLEAIIKNIADTFNQYAVRKLFDLNYFPGLKEHPYVKPGEIETPDLKEISFILRTAGLDVYSDIGLMNLIRRLLSLDELTEEDYAKLRQATIELKEAGMEQDPGKAKSTSNAKPNPNDNSGGKLSVDQDPTNHSLQDNEHFYEGG